MSDQHERTLSIFAGPSEMHSRMRTFDWGATPVGPVEAWPRSLTSVVKTLLASRYPMVLTWGPDFIQFYNDAYSTLIGDKHPAALGQDIRITLAEGWATLGPMITKVMTNGVANWNPALLLVLDRAGYREEAYFDVSHAPAEDDAGQIMGMLAVCSEVTQQVLSDRRLRFLRDLAVKTSEARSEMSICRDIAAVISEHPLDVPFALLYLRDGDQLSLQEVIGLPAGTALSPEIVTLAASGSEAWPFTHAVGGEIVLVETVHEHASVRGGPWNEPVRSALVMPIAAGGASGPRGILIAGVSPNRALEEGYRSFYDLLAGQVSASIRHAQAYEEERQRAEALAQLDRAKTEFFSSVSHEFSTPLTLMLGPLDELLSQPQGSLHPGDRENLHIAHRNTLRLLKMVNTLLEFTRTEADRAEVHYEPVDLAALTANLASAFRSAIEKAGLELVVECSPLPEPAFVDKEMWEKIVLNLLSNAFKFTQQGQIVVRQEVVDGHIELSVTDTGCGIPAAELPHVFKRFHRVAGTTGRTYEGTGIGLALVQELARLHGGTVAVASSEGEGSAFTVSIPLGRSHLPSDRIGTEQKRGIARTDAFIEEALRWLPDDNVLPAQQRAAEPQSGSQPPASDETAAAARPRILLADDNADMRAYIRKLLGASYEVFTVPDGAAALVAVHEHLPDVVLTDVMMPKLDGVSLLAELRADPRTRTIPVILLSARAGEEARAAGLETGADDYLVKPFAARELLARVATHLDLARMRREAGEERSRRSAAEALVRERDQFLALAAHELKTPLTSLRGYLELFMRRMEREERLQVRDLRALHVVAEQVERLNQLVSVLLDVARLEQGQFALQQRRMDLGELVRRVVDGRQLRLTSHALEVQIGDQPLLVNADELRLEQVLQNLISNAIKYSPSGSVIMVAADRQSDHGFISVRDQGIGIPASAQASIFQRFYRADNVNPQQISGLGIGLYVVKEIIARHGGTVNVTSQEGTGSTFTFALPLSGDQTEDLDKAQRPDMRATHH